MRIETLLFDIGEGRGAVRALAVAIFLFAMGCRSTGGDSSSRGATHRHDATSECEEVITAADAQQMFRQLSALHASDRCVLNGLSTQRSVMHVTWTRNGLALPEVIVTPAVCAPRGASRDGNYVIQHGETFATACPATFTALRTTFARDAPAPTRPRSHRSGGHARQPGWTVGVSVGVLLIVLLIVLAVVGWQRRQSSRAYPVTPT